ncbi:MAG: ATP-binding cassette domain-containing protein [Bacteroidales bacterium]|nr:ATP-binding cassette domain-containing protein [Bacteroidales bacterium]
MQEWIELKGVSQNNLKHISLQLPKNKFIVITGISGSGKSSLAFDVINNEGRRNYFINLSGHARKFIDKMEKPKAESIRGLTPTIAVSQSQNNHSPRSTVGTISEIYDLLRLLFARLGKSENKSIEISRSLFSFNSPEGACPNCKGIGLEDKIDPELLIEDANKSIRERAFKITNPKGYIIYSQVTMDALEQVCQAHGFSVDIPWKDLSDEQKNIVLNGSDRITIPYGKHTLESRMKWAGITAKPREEGYYKGILPVMNEILKRDRNPNILRFAKTQLCSKCQGKRLSDKALRVTIDGHTIADLADQYLAELSNTLQNLKLSIHQEAIAEEIIRPIQDRIALLQELGLSYLNCSRTANSLSGGEIQRMRLAKQIASGLRNITFVFDEPSAGVHPLVNTRIIQKLKELTQHGNTVITVEHDEDTMRQADWIVEIGPMAGIHGGEIMFNGSKEDFLKSNHASLTLDYLQKRKVLHLPFKTNKEEKSFSVVNATINNLKNIRADFKYNQMNVICGVSGAGKSSLLFQTLIPLAKNNYYDQIHANGNPALENFDFNQIIYVDQSAIGKTARSTPATYTKLFDSIRNLFAKLPLSKEKKYTASTFSYNTGSGRCAKCEGAGKIETPMHFLGNIEKTCEACRGNRYQEEINKVLYKGKNISEVLQMSFEEALDFFDKETAIQKQIAVINNIGLGYLKLGQSSNSLSGGEAQRIKLAAELLKGKSKNGLYIFNEPSTGLHFNDIQVLLNVFAELLTQGHTLLVIEHHLDIIRNAHHLIELGPSAGENGGKIVFSGSFDEIAKSKTSLLSKSIKAVSSDTFHDSNKNKSSYPIEMSGVRTHNLKGIDVQFPLHAITAIVGKSGSGKSSLAFDTLFAESQNRFTESFPNYVRQYSAHYSLAKYDTVSGLTPVIGLQQKNQVQDARSTLGTITEIYDLYRLLYARFGQHYCQYCQSEIKDGACIACHLPSDIKYSAGHFSFNQPEGSCASCSGLGTKLSSKPHLLISDRSKSLFNGAFASHKSIQFYADLNGQYLATLQKVGERFTIDYSQSFDQLNEEAIDKAFYGTGDELYEVDWQFKRKNRTGTHHFSGKWPGFVALILDEYYRKKANNKGDDLLPFLIEEKCTVCKGTRLKQDVLRVKFEGLNIAELSALSIKQSFALFEKVNNALKTSEYRQLDSQLIENILQKLKALIDMGLGYLQLNRKTSSLSGGEYQRALIGIQLSGNLSGITYVLDEPGTGLHPTDFSIIIKAMQRLKDLGNTIVFTEHHPDIIATADYRIELGPEAGSNGGEILFSGANSPDKNFLTPDLKILSSHYNTQNEDYIEIKQACANNLKQIDLSFKKNALNIVCGVSGSGKTSLVKEVLYASHQAKKALNCKLISGIDSANSMHWISGIKKSTGRQFIAEYLLNFSEIKKLFADQKTAKKAKLKASDFSFQSKSGQCPVCKGQGEITVKLDFLNDLSTLCESCNGQRYKSSILDIHYQGLSIAEVLDLNVSEALRFFDQVPVLKQKLEFIQQMGLSYLKLNQQLKQLSAGEFQRVKIVHEVFLTDIQETIFLFDEPGKGLHPSDLHFILTLFDALLKQQCTLVVIEHNPLLIAQAHHLVELGKGAGDLGGQLVFQGRFQELLKANDSITGAYFRAHM